jgi:hypothetical protein
MLHHQKVRRKPVYLSEDELEWLLALIKCSGAGDPKRLEKSFFDILCELKDKSRELRELVSSANANGFEVPPEVLNTIAPKKQKPIDLSGLSKEQLQKLIVDLKKGLLQDRVDEQKARIQGQEELRLERERQRAQEDYLFWHPPFKDLPAEIQTFYLDTETQPFVATIVRDRKWTSKDAYREQYHITILGKRPVAWQYVELEWVQVQYTGYNN